MSRITVVKVENKNGLVEYDKANLVLPNQEQCSSEDYQLSDGESLASFSLIKDTMRKLMGKTLTVIDASIMDKQQNKAVKDIIKSAFNEELCFASELCFDQEIIQKNLPEDYEPSAGDALDIEDVLNS
jgi:hypothetical protein